MLSLGFLLSIIPHPVSAASAGGLVFNEIQTGSNNAASEEFIELYNSGVAPVSLIGWQVQYASAASTNWEKPTRKINLSGMLEPHSYYVLASTGYSIASNMFFSSTLATAGGHLRLVNGTVPEDIVSWGTASMPLGTAAMAPPAGQSIDRVWGADGSPQSPTNNQSDYFLSNRPTPGQKNSTIATLAAFETVSSGLEISEILPNPAPPITDAAGEFVEIYNSGSQSISLAGYKLTSGTNDSYKYVLPDSVIASGGYLALYSSQTHLTLSNSTGRVRMYDPTGNIADETGVYGKAGDGQSWIFAGSSWQWTTRPTPGQSNILILPSAALKSTKTSSPKKTAAATKSSKPKTRVSAKVQSSQEPKVSKDYGDAAAVETGSHPYVLAGAGVLAVLYACYEYRNDLADHLYRFRKNRATRRAVGRET